MTEAEFAERIAGLYRFLDELSERVRGLCEDMHRLREQNGAVLLKRAEIERRLSTDAGDA